MVCLLVLVSDMVVLDAFVTSRYVNMQWLFSSDGQPSPVYYKGVIETLSKIKSRLSGKPTISKLKVLTVPSQRAPPGS
jgi:hypothetical protein